MRILVLFTVAQFGTRDSAIEISALCPKFIKIPSPINLNFEMQKFLTENFEGKIHISVGMTTELELKQIIDFYKTKKKNR